MGLVLSTTREGAHMSQKPPTRAMRENPDLEAVSRAHGVSVQLATILLDPGF